MKKLKLLTLCVSALSLECFGYKCDICKNYHVEGYKCPVPVIAENDKSQIFDVYDDDEDDVFIKMMWGLEDKEYARWGNPTWTCVPLESLSKAELAAFLKKLMLGNPDKTDKGPSKKELREYMKKLRAENHAERFLFVLRQFGSAVDSVQRELARLAGDGEEKIIKQNAEIWFRFSLRSLYLSTFIKSSWRIDLPKALEQESPLKAALVDFIKYGEYINDMECCFCEIEAERKAVNDFLLGIYTNICPKVVSLTDLKFFEELDFIYVGRLNSAPSEWIDIFIETFVTPTPEDGRIYRRYWEDKKQVYYPPLLIRMCAFETICCHTFAYLNEAITMAISEVRTEIEKAEVRRLFDALIYKYRAPDDDRFQAPEYKRSDRVGEKFAMIMNIVDGYFKLFECLDSGRPNWYEDVIGLIAREEIGERFCKGDYDNDGRSLMYSNYRGIGGKKYSFIGDVYDNCL